MDNWNGSQHAKAAASEEEADPDCRAGTSLGRARGCDEADVMGNCAVLANGERQPMKTSNDHEKRDHEAVLRVDVSDDELLENAEDIAADQPRAGST